MLKYIRYRRYPLQAAEHSHAGMPCGIMDQFISVTFIHHHHHNYHHHHCPHHQHTSHNGQQVYNDVDDVDVEVDDVNKDVDDEADDQGMGKPSNALLIDCRSMEGRLAASMMIHLHNYLTAYHQCQNHHHHHHIHHDDNDHPNHHDQIGSTV